MNFDQASCTKALVAEFNKRGVHNVNIRQFVADFRKSNDAGDLRKIITDPINASDLAKAAASLSMADRLKLSATLAAADRLMKADRPIDAPVHTAATHADELRKFQPDVAALPFADRLKFAAAAHAVAPAHQLTKGASAYPPGQRAADPTLNFDDMVRAALEAQAPEIVTLSAAERMRRIAAIHTEVREHIVRTFAPVDDHRKPVTDSAQRRGQLA